MTKTACVVFEYANCNGRKDRFLTLSEPCQSHKYLHISENYEDEQIVETKAYGAWCNMAVFVSPPVKVSKSKKGYKAVLKSLGYKLSSDINEIDDQANDGDYEP